MQYKEVQIYMISFIGRIQKAKPKLIENENRPEVARGRDLGLGKIDEGVPRYKISVIKKKVIGIQGNIL